MNHDLEIDPDKIQSRRRRPVPPGQNRHRYADQPVDAPDNDIDDSADDPDDDIEARSSDSARQTQRRRRAAKAPVTVDGETETRGRRSGTGRRPVTVSDDDESTDKAEPWLVRFVYDRRLSVFLGLTCLFVAAMIIIVLLSQLKSGELDQTAIMNMTVDDIVASGVQIYNVMGPFGARAGDLLFTKAFGVGSFIIAIYLGALGIKLLRRRRIEFWAMTFRSGLLAVTLSIVVGLMTFTLETPVFWGGIHGHYVNAYVRDYAGWIGCLFLSGLLIAAVVCVYLNALIRYYSRWRQLVKARREAREAAAEKLRRLAALRAQEEEEAAAAEAEEANEEHETEEVVESVVPVFDIEPISLEGLDEPVDQSVEPAKKDDTADEPGFEIDAPVIDIDTSGGDVAGRSEAGQGDYDPRADLSHYKFPSLEILEDRPMRQTVDREEQENNKDRIIKALADHRISIVSIKATVGPTVTLYEIVPADGVRIAQIKRLEDDIAMSLAAKGIRIIAPMPGKGTVGIEVPNSDPQTVSMRTVLASRKFRETKAKLPVALGATISNEFFIADLADMPHALVAGATGQGKSVGLNAIITSLLYKKHPSELKFVLIDPKMVEFSLYARLERHFLATLPDEEEAIVTDPSKVLNVLNSLCVEMDNRYSMLKKAGTNKIEDYNNKFIKRRLNPEQGHKYLPYIVVIIDEFADLMMMGGKEIETPVTRITQKARAVGIHMVIATQRPSTNVLTGLIKANCPTRIAFRTIQMVDSRTILDRPGAEKLIGRGDMLFTRGGDVERMQCAFISTDEVEAICDAVDAQVGYEHAYYLPEPLQGGEGASGGAIAGGSMDRDTLFDEAARFIIRQSTASTSSLQRRFQIGYNRAGKIMDQMEAAGIVSAGSGSKPREVLVNASTLETILSQR